MRRGQDSRIYWMTPACMIAFKNNQKYPVFRANGSPLKARKERSPEVAQRTQSGDGKLCSGSIVGICSRDRPRSCAS
jgi:hypothetical protein